MSRRRELRWVASSKKDMRAMPKGIRADFGFGLQEVTEGRTPEGSKVLTGFGGADVLELREDASSGTYRAVYTVRFEDAVYVLHAFQKKSRQGIATSHQDLELIRARLKAAEHDHRQRQEDSH